MLVKMNRLSRLIALKRYGIDTKIDEAINNEGNQFSIVTLCSSLSQDMSILIDYTAHTRKSYIFALGCFDVWDNDIYLDLYALSTGIHG